MKSKEQKYKEAVERNLRGIFRSNQHYLERSFNTAKSILAKDGEVALQQFVEAVLEEMSAIDKNLHVCEVARRAGMRRSDLDHITNSVVGHQHEWHDLLLAAKRPLSPQFKMAIGVMMKAVQSSKNSGKRKK